MSRPVKKKSLDGATGTGSGSSIQTGGRITVSLFVVTDADPTTLDVEVEASFDGENWGPILNPAGTNRLSVSAEQFEDREGDGTYVALVTAHGIAADEVRARITDYGTGGNVTAWVAATSNPQTGYDYRNASG